MANYSMTVEESICIRVNTIAPINCVEETGQIDTCKKKRKTKLEHFHIIYKNKPKMEGSVEVFFFFFNCFFVF